MSPGHLRRPWQGGTQGKMGTQWNAYAVLLMFGASRLGVGGRGPHTRAPYWAPPQAPTRVGKGAGGVGTGPEEAYTFSSVHTRCAYTLRDQGWLQNPNQCKRLLVQN